MAAVAGRILDADGIWVEEIVDVTLFFALSIFEDIEATGVIDTQETLGSGRQASGSNLSAFDAPALCSCPMRIFTNRRRGERARISARYGRDNRPITGMCAHPNC